MAVDADVLIPRIRGPHGDEPEAIGGVLHIDLRVPVLRPDVKGIARRGVPRTVRPIAHRLPIFVIDVQGAQMGGIDVPLDALGWVGTRRVALPHVSSSPPFRTGLAAFTASGSTPWFFS